MSVSSLHSGIVHAPHHSYPLMQHTAIAFDGICQCSTSSLMPAADYITIKSSWGRITEFLALLGGLYTTCLAIGLMVWFLVEFSVPPDTGVVGQQTAQASAPAVPSP